LQANKLDNAVLRFTNYLLSFSKDDMVSGI